MKDRIRERIWSVSGRSLAGWLAGWGGRGLGGLDQVVDVDVEVVIELDEVDGRLGLHLVDDHPRALATVLLGVLHLLAHQAVHHLAGLALCRHTLVWTHTQSCNMTSLPS